MKANGAKSKFVYPDKLYARTKDNITLDISYAPQNLEAVEYTLTDAFIEKASKWIIDNFPTVSGISALMYADDFKKAML